MRIRISDPAQLEDLRCALREGGVASTRIEPDTLTVLDPFSSDEDESRVEIMFFVRAWLADRPNLEVDLAA
jgi:hypothetical protein